MNDSNAAVSWHLYRVDRATWADADEIPLAVSATVDSSLDADLLQSGTIAADDDIGTGYVRLVCEIDSGMSLERFDVATLYASSSRRSGSVAVMTSEAECYSVLLPASTVPLGIGDSVPSRTDPVRYALDLLRKHLDAPVSNVESGIVTAVAYVPEEGETVLSFAAMLLGVGGYRIDIDGFGTVTAKPVESEPVATIDLRDSDFITGDVTDELDLYGIPNVVMLRDQEGRTVTAVNDDWLSPTSTAAIGFEKWHVESVTTTDGETLLDMAYSMLDSMSGSSRKVSYMRSIDGSIGLGDRIRLSLPAMGIEADLVIATQTISTDSGAVVAETATEAFDTFRR